MYGNEIKKAREINGATQLQVAKAIQMPQSTISWIELDKGIPNIQQCVQLAQYYGITLDELVGLTDNPAQNTTRQNLPSVSKTAVSFTNEFEEILSDKNFVNVAKLYKAVTPELRALVFGYVVGMLQSQGVNTQKILKY